MKALDCKYGSRTYFFLMKRVYYYYVFNILCMCAMSVNEITKLAVLVLAFQ